MPRGVQLALIGCKPGGSRSTTTKSARAGSEMQRVREEHDANYRYPLATNESVFDHHDALTLGLEYSLTTATNNNESLLLRASSNY